MGLVDAKRLLKIQLIRLYNERFTLDDGLTSKQIARYLNRVNPRKFAITNDVSIY